MRNFCKKLAAAVIAAGILSVQCAFLPAQAADSTPDFSYLGAAGGFTEKQTQEIAKAVYSCLAAHKSSTVIKISGGSITTGNYQNVIDIARAVLSCWDVGVLTSRYSIGYNIMWNGTMQFVPSYLVDDADYHAEYQKVNAQLDEIISGMDENWSDAEKALYLHEYISLHYDYDYDEPTYTQWREKHTAHSAYGMLSKGEAVCDGYSSLYSVLLHRAGIDSELVECDSMLHAWNLVELNGKWYHVDTTFDDDEYKGHTGLVSHRSFLKTRDEMLTANHSTDGSEDDWKLTSGRLVSDMPSDSFYSDGFWNNSNAFIQQYQDKWLAIHGVYSGSKMTAWFDLCDYDAVTNTAEITHLNSLDTKWAKWYVYGSEIYYYTNTYVTPAVAGDTIYYTTPTSIFSLKENNQIAWLLDLDQDQRQQGYIYGMYLDGTTLHYYVSTSPQEELHEYTVEIPDYQEETVPETSAATTTTTPKATTTTTTTTTKATTTTTTTTTTKATTTTTTTTTPKATTTTTTTTPKATTTTTTTTTPKATTTTTTTTPKATTTTTTTAPKATTTTTTTTTPKATTTTTTTTTPKATTTTTTTTTPKATTTTTTTAPKATTTTTTTATTTTTTAETTTTATETTVIQGDINNDCHLSVKDIILMQKYLHGQGTLTESDFLRADLTNDNIVNIYDFIAMKKKILNA